MDFETIANEIVEQSIRSAICIDDKFVEPYATKSGDGDDDDTPKKLLISFRDKGCSLDVYRYTTPEHWNSNKNFILNNRDLLILDWELDNSSNYKEPLEILWNAVELESLPFVIIYTQMPDFTEIEININSFFANFTFNTHEMEVAYETFCSKLEDDTDISDPNKTFESMSSILKDYATSSDDDKIIIMKEIQKQLKEEVDSREIGNFMKTFVRAGGDILSLSKFEDIIMLIAYQVNNAEVSNKDNNYKVITVEGVENSFIINNTTIVIYHKPKSIDDKTSATLPEDVYSQFAQSIHKYPRNFLALLSLEMKNIFRNNSGIIGNELYGINEVAFFFHRQSLGSEDEFHDFLRNCWGDELSTFSSTQTPKLFTVFDKYIDLNDIGPKIEAYRSDDRTKFLNELAKLNYHYSFSKVEIKEDDKIHFGDIFTLSEGQNGEKFKRFMLCITPHCDCHRPDKINNHLYFVSGHQCNIEIGLHDAESEYFSFMINDDDEPICIQWTGKPFTFHIDNADNNSSNAIKVTYGKDENYLSYKATQKENYTQRIANHSFSYASRVGINLVNTREKQPK
ncbi:response regulator receiver domain [Methanococcoides sp. NM1]|uniref:response regulator receiver domain n=1 Tax=Methanococcoides sp. NM1 TaxID=1201013 RepID=UPI0010825881|nr:response regulator receiver domain [Methanococcoides sp. NM1]